MSGAARTRLVLCDVNLSEYPPIQIPLQRDAQSIMLSSPTVVTLQPRPTARPNRELSPVLVSTPSPLEDELVCSVTLAKPLVSSMIRESVAAAKQSTVSPPLVITSSSSFPLPSSLAQKLVLPPHQWMRLLQSVGSDASSMDESIANFRSSLEKTFPTRTMGRATTLRGTSCRIRHFAISRFHCTIAVIPNSEVKLFLLPLDDASPSPPVVTDVVPKDEGARMGRGRSRRKQPPDDVSSPSNGNVAPDHKKGSTTDTTLNDSLVIFNWSKNKLFVNDAEVPECGKGGVVLKVGDLISFLECSLDPVHGIATRDRFTGVIHMNLAPSVNPKLGGDEDSLSFLIPTESAKKRPVCKYDPLRSPLQFTASKSDPRPLPVFKVMLDRDCSPPSHLCATTATTNERLLEGDYLSAAKQKKKRRRYS